MPKLMSLVGIAMFSVSAISTAISHEVPPLNAIVSYESRTLNHEGVTETRQFKNALVRRAGHIWVERVMPQSARLYENQGKRDDNGGHRHFDFGMASQHLTQSENGITRADYVDRIGRQIVFVPPTEYSVSGFDGSWENAGMIVSRETVKAMSSAKNLPKSAEGEWYEQARNGWYNKVLWSENLQVAIVVESGRTDGSAFRRTTLEIKPLTPDSELPWKQLAGYVQKEYDDFMD